MRWELHPGSGFLQPHPCLTLLQVPPWRSSLACITALGTAHVPISLHSSLEAHHRSAIARAETGQGLSRSVQKAPPPLMEPNSLCQGQSGCVAVCQGSPHGINPTK